MRGVLAVLVLGVGACGSSGSTPDATIGGGDGDSSVDAAVDSTLSDADQGTGFHVGGSALGVREPARLAIEIGVEHHELIVSEDGAFAFPRRFPSGSMYTVTTTNPRCRIANGTGTVTGEVTSVQLYCIGVVELASVGFTPDVVVLAPTFNPDGTTYSGSRPFFGDDTDLVSATPTALYAAESTIAVYGAQTTSGTTSPPHAYAGGVPIVVTHTATNLSLTYTIAPAPLPRFEAYIKASDPAAFAGFSAGKATQTWCGGVGENGNGIAISGNTLVVGAPCATARQGAVYVYTRTNTTWTFQAKLVATSPGNDDQFGASVAIDGDTIVVGAPFDDGPTNGSSNSGAVYVFTRSGTTWSTGTYVRPATSVVSGEFGLSVAVSGSTIAAGTPYDSNGGTVYVFTGSGTTWTQQAGFRGTNTEAGDAFAISVALSGDTLVCGASQEAGSATTVNGAANNNASGAGAAYVFVRSGSSWSQQAYLKTSNMEAGDGLGMAVSIDGNSVAVGAPGEDSGGAAGDNSVPGAGAVYVFARSGSTWTQDGYLKAAIPRSGNALGLTVALARNGVVAGAYSDDSSSTGIDSTAVFGGATLAGAAYAFRRDATGWTLRHYIKAGNTDANDYFGASVAAGGDTFAVGAFGEDSNGSSMADNTLTSSGAVYVFR